MSRFTKEKGSNIYLTPPSIIQALGGADSFDLDPAYLPKFMQPWKTAKNSYCEEDDGLIKPWHGRIWCNPPYLRSKGKTVFEWVKKMRYHGDGNMLINATTDTKYWHHHVFEHADGVLFMEGRIQFLDINGNPIEDKYGRPAPSEQPSAIIAYGINNLIALKKANSLGRIRGHLIVQK